VLIAERAQFPELAETFYRVGPGATRARLAEYLARETARGRLNTPEPDVAAEHFLGMLTGHSYMRRLLGLETAPTDAAKARRIEAAVRGFLRAYAP
jgi:TetR/AcrR family transcriptional repressor of mexJK operon